MLAESPELFLNEI
jgi:hypothetical protein